MADEDLDVKPAAVSSPAADVKADAPSSSDGAGETKTDSPPATVASDKAKPADGKSHREALIASLSQDKKEDEKPAEEETPAAAEEPAAEPEKAEAEAIPDKPAGDDATVTAKPERAKKDTLVENVRKLSDENKSLRSIQNFAAPILDRLGKSKIPPAEFHQLTDTFINARARGVDAERLVAWTNLGAETLSAEDAAQRLYDMAVQHGYKPGAPAVPVVAPEDEAFIAAQHKAGLIDDELAARMRKMAAKMPPAPAARPRPAAPAPRAAPAPQQEAGLPAATVDALAKMGNYADAVRKQHQITDADWPAIDKQIIARLNKLKADAGGNVPVSMWPSSFQLAADAVVADFLKRRPAATKPVQSSLRPSKSPGAGTDAGLSEREKVIRRFAS